MANERNVAAAFVEQVLAYCRPVGTVQFFAVLDHKSRDGTLELMRGLAHSHSGVRVVWAPENRSVVDAYMRGYHEALNSDADWILEIDCGFSHQPSDIPKFLAAMAQGYDCAFGSRFCEDGRMSDSPFSRYVISRGGTLLANLLLGTTLQDMTSGFQMFTRRALVAILDKGIRSRGHFFQTEMKVHARHMRVAEIPIHYRAASDSVNRQVLADALRNLGHLWKQRLNGSL